MLRTNVDKLVKISVVGEVASPVYGGGIYRISAQGNPVVLPSVGGITYNVRVGDLVAIRDADHSYGRIYKQGAMSVGIVVHTNCVSSGHGPGVTTLFTSSTGKIIPKIDSKANIGLILGLRTDI
jgi:hypothetical protein